MFMDNKYSQSAIAYENSPKEKNYNRRMPDGDRQFGKEDKTMPQDSKPATKGYVKKAIASHEHKMHRHKEHR